MNAKTCLQQSELVPMQSFPNQFIDIFFDNYQTVLGKQKSLTYSFKKFSWLFKYKLVISFKDCNFCFNVLRYVNYKTIDSKTTCVFFPGDNCTVMLDFFTRLAVEVDKHKEDGSVKESFWPILDTIQEHLQKELNLMHVALFKYLDLLMFFSRTEPLALVSYIYLLVFDGEWEVT